MGSFSFHIKKLSAENENINYSFLNSANFGRSL